MSRGRSCSPTEREGEARRATQEAQAASEALIGQAKACVATSATLRVDAVRLRVRAEEIRRRPTEGWGRRTSLIVSFSLTGVIENHDVHADWRDGRLVADPLLLERAQLVVDLKERFLAPNGTYLTASLTGLAIVALLTLMQACDRVRQVDVIAPELAPGLIQPGVSRPGLGGGTGSG